MMQQMESLLDISVYLTLGLSLLFFCVAAYGIVKGVGWLFSKARTSREATEKQLRALRWSTAKRFFLTMGIALGMELVLQALWPSIFNDARIGSAGYLGILLTALSDLFLASSIVLLISVFTRPISQIIGSMLDLLQSAVLAFLTGLAVRNVAELSYFRVTASDVPIAAVFCVASILYSVSGTALWAWEERRSSLPTV